MRGRKKRKRWKIPFEIGFSEDDVKMASNDGKVASRKEKGVMTTIRKSYRVSEEIDKKIKELLELYGVKSENELFEFIVRDIYEIRKSKALVPIEELKEKDKELKECLLELGRLKGILEEKGFFARIFGKK